MCFLSYTFRYTFCVDLNQYRLPFTSYTNHTQTHFKHDAEDEKKDEIGKKYKNGFNFLVD